MPEASAHRNAGDTVNSALPSTGHEHRFWNVIHQPNRAKVLRIELREKLPEVADKEPRKSLSTLIGWTNSHATDEDVKKACTELKLQAGRALEFVGIHK